MIYSTKAQASVTYGSFGITSFYAFETLQYYIVLCHSEGRAYPEHFSCEDILHIMLTLSICSHNSQIT